MTAVMEKCLFRSFLHFLVGLFVFLALSCMSYLYIFELNPLSVVSFGIIFSLSEGCLFTLLIVSFAVQKLLSLITSHLFAFVFTSIAVGVWGAARENRVLYLKDTALGAASVLEGLLTNIALCPTTPEIRRLFTADTWSSGQTSHTQGNVIWCKK